MTQPQTDEDPEPDLSRLGFLGTAGTVLECLGVGFILFGFPIWRVRRSLRRDRSLFSWYHTAGAGIAGSGIVMTALGIGMVRLAERRAKRGASAELPDANAK
jgi:hypothetical protein